MRQVKCNADVHQHHQQSVALGDLRACMAGCSCCLSLLKARIVRALVMKCATLLQACPDGEEACPRADDSLAGNFVSFGCRGTKEYNDLATLFFNTQDDAIRNLFSTGTTQEYSTMALLVFFVAFYGLTIITYGLPLPAGAPLHAASLVDTHSGHTCPLAPF